jgi:hypothetical protein
MRNYVCVLICEHVEGSCLGLFQGTEWTVCFMAEERRFDTPSRLRRVPLVGRCNSGLRWHIEMIITFRKSSKTYQCCSRCWKYCPLWPSILGQAGNGQLCTIPLHIEWTEKNYWPLERSLVSGLKFEPGTSRNQSCNTFLYSASSYRHWLRHLHSWLVSPAVKRRIVETCVVVKLAICAVLTLVLHSHTVSGQLYVLVTVPQEKGSPIPPGPEAILSSRVGLGAMAGRNIPASVGCNWKEENKNNLSHNPVFIKL